MSPRSDQILAVRRALIAEGRKEDEADALIANQLQAQRAAKDVLQDRAWGEMLQEGINYVVPNHINLPDWTGLPDITIPGSKSQPSWLARRGLDAVKGVSSFVPSVLTGAEIARDAGWNFYDRMREPDIPAQPEMRDASLVGRMKRAAKYDPLIGYPTALMEEAYNRIPEDKKAEGVISALGGVLATMTPQGRVLSPAVKAALGSTLAPELVTQAKEALGIEPVEPLSDALERVQSNVTQGVGGVLVPETTSKLSNAISRGTLSATQTAYDRLLNFRDRAFNRARAFTDDWRFASTRQGVPLHKALSDPFIREVIEVDPPKATPDNPTRSRFPVILGRVQEAKAIVGEGIDLLLDKVASDRKIKVKDIDFSHVREKATTGAESSRRPARRVLDREMDNFARDALTAEEFRDYLKLKRHQAVLEGVDYELTITSDIPPMMSADETSRLLDLQDKVGNHELDIKQLRKYKSDYGRAGAYDRLKDPELEVEADAYRDMHAAVAKKINKIVGLDDEGNVPSTLQGEARKTAERYKELNSRYQTLADLEPLTGKRVESLALEGRGAYVGSYRAREEGAPQGVLDRVGRWMYPEMASPEARLTRADLRPWRREHAPLAFMGQRLLGAAATGSKWAGNASEGMGRFANTPYAGLASGMNAALDTDPSLAGDVQAEELPDMRGASMGDVLNVLNGTIGVPTTPPEGQESILRANMMDQGMAPTGTQLPDEMLVPGGASMPETPSALGGGQEPTYLGAITPNGVPQPPGQELTGGFDSSGEAQPTIGSVLGQEPQQDLLTPSVAAAPEPAAPAPLPRNTDKLFGGGADVSSLPPDAQQKLRDAENFPIAMKRQTVVELMKDGTIPFEDPGHDWLRGYNVVDDRIVDPDEQRSLTQDLLDKERDEELSLYDSTKLRAAIHSGKPVVPLFAKIKVKKKSEVPPEPKEAPAVKGEDDSPRMTYDF